MHFDALARFVERHALPAKPLLDECRLFLFPGRAHELLPPLPEQAENAGQFFLPYDSVALEDSAGCVVLTDVTQGAVGLDSPRTFINYRSLAPEFAEEGDPLAADGDDAHLDVTQCGKGDCVVTFGMFESISINPGGQSFHYRGAAPRVGAVVHGQYRENKEASKAAQQTAIGDVLVAVREIMFFNQPDRFILEKTAAKRRPDKKRKKILRGHERPQYTLLTPHAIRTKLGMAHPGNGSPKAPHERRRHERTYRADRYVNVRGKTQIIPAMWIGPHEKRVGRHIYRVVLDR